MRTTYTVDAPPKNRALDHSSWKLSESEIDADLALFHDYNPANVVIAPITQPLSLNRSSYSLYDSASPTSTSLASSAFYSSNKGATTNQFNSNHPRHFSHEAASSLSNTATNRSSFEIPSPRPFLPAPPTSSTTQSNGPAGMNHIRPPSNSMGVPNGNHPTSDRERSVWTNNRPGEGVERNSHQISSGTSTPASIAGSNWFADPRPVQRQPQSQQQQQHQQQKSQLPQRSPSVPSPVAQTNAPVKPIASWVDWRPKPPVISEALPPLPRLGLLNRVIPPYNPNKSNTKSTSAAPLPKSDAPSNPVAATTMDWRHSFTPQSIPLFGAKSSRPTPPVTATATAISAAPTPIPAAPRVD
jgi:hypothetical protein